MIENICIFAPLIQLFLPQRYKDSQRKVHEARVNYTAIGHNIIYINIKLDSCLHRKDRCSFICHSCSEGAPLARMQESPALKVNFFYSLMLRIVSHRGTKRTEIFLLLLISPRIHTDDHRLMKQVFIIH